MIHWLALEQDPESHTYRFIHLDTMHLLEFHKGEVCLTVPLAGEQDERSGYHDPVSIPDYLSIQIGNSGEILLQRLRRANNLRDLTEIEIYGD